MTEGRRQPLVAAARTTVALLVFLVIPMSAGPRAAHAQTIAWVDTGGDCLRMRAEPGLQGADVVCLEHGTAITLLAESEERDGFTWRRMEYEGQTGWVAEFYVTTDPIEVQPLTEPPVAVGGLPEPPVGGLTLGVAESGLSELLAALPYPVVSVWHLDLETQQLLRHIPSAPEYVNTLSALEPGDVVMVLRAGELTDTGAPPEASLTVAGTPNALETPPVGGLTQGVSGTTDPEFLVRGQAFSVESVAYFHVDSQRWLTYLPGAPDAANSLEQGQLRVDSVVTLRRGPDPDPAEQVPVESGRFEASVTYYYCVPGSNPAGIGDAGGYCGAMANGEQVHEGAAACAPDRLGERFRIEGDPTGRTYTCTDTGGSVLRDHRDIWFMNSDDGYAWWLQVGERAIVQIVE